MNFKRIYKPFGNAAILIEWPSLIDESIIKEIIVTAKKIEKNEAILDSVIAYNSLLLKYENPISDFDAKIKQLKKYESLKKNTEKKAQKLWEIPVCYDESFGIDILEIANQKKYTIDEVINLHTQTNYLIYFIGFQPGFLYLGGLNEQIHMPRRSNPRVRIDKGSVGIGGGQTGIYPQDSAGGWNIIGKSPVDFFIISKEQPCFAEPGDRVQFFSIDLATFNQLEKEVATKDYTPNFSWL